MDPHQSRVRRVTFVALGLCIAALVATLATMLVQTTFAAVAAPFAPSAADGVIPEETIVTLADDGVPAIARLDVTLRDAMRRAEADAAVDEISFQITSGWRSAAYQQWLLDDAVEQYQSEEIARQFVATPDRSSHVTGHAVDIGPVDAQFWLIEHGAHYGICQTYANERWHFELATQPGGQCPEMRMDASG